MIDRAPEPASPADHCTRPRVSYGFDSNVYNLFYGRVAGKCCGQVHIAGKCADEGRVIAQGVAPVTTPPEFVIEIDRRFVDWVERVWWVLRKNVLRGLSEVVDIKFQVGQDCGVLKLRSALGGCFGGNTIARSGILKNRLNFYMNKIMIEKYFDANLKKSVIGFTDLKIILK